MEDFYNLLDEKQKRVFLKAAQIAEGCGYHAKKDKSKTLSYTFVHPKVKRTILRFAIYNGIPLVKFKFFASKDYSSFFHETIRLTIEEYHYRYTGCYDCGKCDGSHGYKYRYVDGREFYRCGTELIDIWQVDRIPLEEFEKLFKIQHDFYLANYS